MSGVRSGIVPARACLPFQARRNNAGLDAMTLTRATRDLSR